MWSTWARMLGGEEPTVTSATANAPRSRGRPGHEGRAALPERPHRLGALLDVVLGHSSTWPPGWSATRASCGCFNPIAPQFVSWLTVRSGGARRFEIPARRPTYAYQLDAFCDAVLRAGPVLTPPQDAVANMTVIDAVYRAANMRPTRTDRDP